MTVFSVNQAKLRETNLLVLMPRKSGRVSRVMKHSGEQGKSSLSSAPAPKGDTAADGSVTRSGAGSRPPTQVGPSIGFNAPTLVSQPILCANPRGRANTATTRSRMRSSGRTSMTSSIRRCSCQSAVGDAASTDWAIRARACSSRRNALNAASDRRRRSGRRASVEVLPRVVSLLTR